jgi:hypothetical protein
MDSWGEEEYIADDYYRTRRTRRRFKRWGWVVAVTAAALALAAPYAWRVCSELLASTMGQITAPAPAPRPWLARTILNREGFDAMGNTWLIKRLALQSRAESFRLQLKLTNSLNSSVELKFGPGTGVCAGAESRSRRA